ncbi:MAG: hypothetical protein PWQ88_632 [Candidatus Methanomethylophilaceae archaeon]|nr:hypothetical protein [Candidatus Methanomethylophilaceae archaeon]
MSFWDKLKSFFKKKERKEEAKEPQQTALSKALDLAESKLMEKEGEMSASELERFRSRIAALRKNVGADEESALISVSQLIGAIARAKKREAPKEKAPEEKKPTDKMKNKKASSKTNKTGKKKTAKKSNK